MKRTREFFLFFLLAATLSACGGDVPPPAVKVSDRAPEVSETIEEPAAPSPAEEPKEVSVKIGLMLPLSGTEASVGKGLFNAATMALYDAYDPRIEMVVFDTLGTPDGARSAADRALTAEVDVVVGPLLADNVRVVGAFFSEYDIPVLGLSSDSRVAGDNTFVFGFLAEAEVKRVVDFAAGRELGKYAALIPESRYGARVREAFGDSVFDAGGSIVALETYPSDPESVTDSVKKVADYDIRRKNHRDEVRFLRSLGDDMTDEVANRLDVYEVSDDVDIDAILLPEGGALLRTLAPLLPFYEVDLKSVRLLGTGLWYDHSLIKEPPLIGAWFAAPDPTGADAFLKNYADRFGQAAPRVATTAYDAVALVALLCRNYDRDAGGRVVTAAKLTDPAGFQGVDGLFRLLPDGTNERALAVLEITKKGFTVQDPAPRAFPRFGFEIKQIVEKE